MEILQLKENKTLEVLPWKNSKVRAGFSTRQNGVSKPPYESLNMGIHVDDAFDAVETNRVKFSQWIHRSVEQWFSVNQVHSNQIIDLSLTSIPRSDFNHSHPKVNADGLITNNQSHVLTAYYADCVPLLFKSKDDEWIGVAHAGWKGTVLEIGPRMIEIFNKKGVELDQIEVVIGPCISRNNYEVDQRVIRQIPERYYSEVLTQTKEFHYLLDLKRLNQMYLVDAGVKLENIYTTNFCTYEGSDLFFSHRRDRGRTGRMMAYIYIES